MMTKAARLLCAGVVQKWRGEECGKVVDGEKVVGGGGKVVLLVEL